jgi:DNA-binding MurR/RpiR family transcriptional regulator
MTSIEIKTRSMLDSFNNSERKVANYLLDNITSIYSTPVAILAEKSDVSQVTWIRFCKAIGFEGLKELKKTLVQELNTTPSESKEKMDFSDIRQYSTLEEMQNAIKSTTIQAVTSTLAMLDFEVLHTIVNLIAQADRVKLFGVGASALVAQDFYNKLLRINKNVIFSLDTHMQLTYGSNTSPEDLAIIFSYSGCTKEMIEVLNLAKKAQCPTIAITKYSKSPLANDSDYSLYISAPEIDHRSGAMSSRIAQLTLVDLLFTGIANKTYDDVEKYLELSSEVRRTHRLN